MVLALLLLVEPALAQVFLPARRVVPVAQSSSSPEMNNLWAWWKADAISASEGDALASWVDSSGNGNDLTQSASARRATYRTNRINSLPAVHFAGTNYFDAPTGFTNFVAGHFFIVVQIDQDRPDVDTYPNSIGLFRLGRSDTTDGTSWPQSSNPTSHPWVSFGASRDIALTFTTNSYLVWRRGEFSAATNNHRGYINENPGFVVTNLGGPVWGTNFWTIGRSSLNNGTSTNFLRGEICEMLFYSTNLTDVQRAVTSDYLISKYFPSTPTELDTNNLAGWFKATDLTGLNDGDIVSTWTNALGDGNDLTQATAGVTPVYKTNRLSGLPAVNYGTINSNSFHNIPNFYSGFTSTEIFVVIDPDADPAPSAALSGFWRTGTSGQGSHFPFTDGDIYDDFGATTRINIDVNPPLTSGLFYNYRIGSGLRKQGTFGRDYLLWTGTVGWDATGYIGRSQSGATSYYFFGDISEILWFSSQLSLDQRRNVIRYLEDRYSTFGYP